jgi:hypothetical protein
MPHLARLLLGLVCGWLLSRLRLVPGDAWLDGPAVPATAALVVRGVALVLVGLALGRTARGLGVPTLVGVALGLAGHGLLLGSPLGLPAWDLLVAAVVLGLAAAYARRADEAEGGEQPAPAHVGERIGLCLAGGGTAIVLEVVARHARLLGGGLAQDDSALATTFVVLLALGGACFGWLANWARVERWVLPWLVVAAGAACASSLSTLERIGQVFEFERFLKHYGLDTTWHATLAADALVAGAVFVVPAFLLGIALRGARGAGSLSSTLVGAGVGLALLPHILHRDSSATTSVEELFSAQILPFGLLAALMGAGLALLSVPGRSARARWIAFVCVLPLGLPILLANSKPLFLLSPWERRPTLPFLAFETPAGLATVEPGAGGLKLATLDRARLSPGLDGVRAESQAIEASFRALPRSVRDARNVRVLLVGQLTQARASVFTRQGAGRIDRTGAWHAAMPRLEDELLADYPVPPGDVIGPDEAARRLANAQYDLCVVLAIDGDPPRWRAIPPPPEATVVVRWSRIEEPLAARLPGSRFALGGEREPLYAVAGGGLEHLMLGVLDGAVRPAAGEPGRLEIVRLEGSIPAACPITRLLERKVWRAASATRAVTERVAEQNPGSLWRGIDHFAQLQIPSSPFETESEQVELDEEVLADLRDAALAEPPSAFVRDVWNWIARVLAGKRDVSAIGTFVAPIAARWAPWPELEVALARADIEALDPAAAALRLTSIADAPEASFDVLCVLGEAREQAGDSAGAVAVWKRALPLRPNDAWIRRHLAMARVRTGDPGGAEAVRQWLDEHPEDEEMRTFLGPGPWPEPAVGPSSESSARREQESG